MDRVDISREGQGRMGGRRVERGKGQSREARGTELRGREGKSREGGGTEYRLGEGQSREGWRDKVDREGGTE